MTPDEWRVPQTVGIVANYLKGVPNTIVLLSLHFDKQRPFVPDDGRATFTVLDAGVFSVVLHFGYSEPLTKERFSIRGALANLAVEKCVQYPALASLNMPEEATILLQRSHYAIDRTRRRSRVDKLRI